MFFPFFKLKQSKSTPFPRLLGVCMTNTRQKGASGLWTAEECLGSSLDCGLQKNVSGLLFIPSSWILSARSCSHTTSCLLPASSSPALSQLNKSRLEESNRRGKQGTKNNPLVRINSTGPLKFPSSGEVLDGWNMTGMNTKDAQRQNSTMLLMHLPEMLALLCPAAALIYNHLRKIILYVLYSSKKSWKVSSLCFFPFKLGPISTLALNSITPVENQLRTLLLDSQT